MYISINQISKKFGDNIALQNINLQIRKNEIFGFIGPDGSGKTTLLKILATLMIPDTGNVKILEYDIIKDFKNIRKLIGYMPSKFSLYSDLSVEENLTFFASIYNFSVSENYHLIRDIYKYLEPFKNLIASKLSGGMKQKLALCCAIVHQPKILILDEPTTAVDVISRNDFWQILKIMQQKGITTILSTPYMDEANLCDRIALMKDGKIIDIDTPLNIVHKFSGILYALQSDILYPLKKYIETLQICKMVYLVGKNIHLQVEKEQDIKKLMEKISDKGFKINKLKKILPEIEDCFIQLTTTKQFYQNDNFNN